MTNRADIPLFSYGSLRQPGVQRATFGRLLDGHEDALPGYALGTILIDEPEVAEVSGASVHSIARPTGHRTDLIPGVVFLLTAEELAAADAYETDAYARVEATLASGQRAFVYVAAEA
jgi:gamma-glutamylcyclotransferase (GGCT)/AIG2-like uncharacterized protein YtfP